MNVKKIISDYKNGKSCGQIAKEFNTYPNKILRILKKNGVELRSRSEAQKNALETGTIKHPTKGTHRNQKTKLKISNKLSEFIENLSDAEKEERAKKSKELWNNKTEGELAEMRRLAMEAVRKASKDGSKLERFVLEELNGLGYIVQHQVTQQISNEKMHLDLYLPELSTIIEIDGPSHFLPIWGEDKLEQVQKSDELKNGLLAASGYYVIRVKNIKTKLSHKARANLIDNLDKQLKVIESGKQKNKILEIEV